MSIVFTIKNKYNLEKDYSQCNVLIDDNLSTLKTRLYGITQVGETTEGESEPDYDLYPNLLKVELLIDEETNETVVVTDSSNPIISYYTGQSIPQNPIIYFSTLKDHLEKEYAGDITNLFIIMGTPEYDIIFNKLKAEFVDLNETDLQMIIYYSVYSKTQDQFIDDAKLELLDYYVNTTLRNAYLSLRPRVLKNKYNDTIISYPVGEFDKFFVSETGEIVNPEESVYYTGVSLNITPKNIETGTRGRIIKSRTIFNTIELDENIPFVSIGYEGMSDTGERNPLIKVYNSLNKMVSEREFRSWVLTEKKKAERVSYKRVRGINFRIPVVFSEDTYGQDELEESKNIKTKFVFVSLHDTGVINVKVVFEEEDRMADLTTIVEIILRRVDNLIENINELGGIYIGSKRLSKTADSNIITDDINCIVNVKMETNRKAMITQLNKQDVKSTAFELKDIKSTQFISMYYKKHTVSGEGITINLKDNPYKAGSSIIVIYGSSSLIQILTIVKQLIVLNEIAKGVQKKSLFKKQEEIKEIKTKSHIKLLKRKGVDISSKKCPRFKLPNVDDNTQPLEGSYALEFENKRYTCQNPAFPYPGFTVTNNVCCFKKDQRGKANYIRNMGYQFQITLHPSNFKIKLKLENEDKTVTEIETYVLKASNEYMEMHKSMSANSKSKIPLYYWLNKKELVGITDKTIIKKIESMDIQTDGRVWLEDALPLSVLTGEAIGSNCKYLPDFENDTPLDINKKCEHHETNKFFGYNLNSFPCCFFNERELIINRQRKKQKIKHIFNTDKLLEHERIGVLQSYFDILFNGQVNNKSGYSYYRMGVNQNNSAFFNAVLMAIEDDPNLNIKTPMQFRNHLLEYLNKNENEYRKLRGGLVALKYGELRNYKDWLEDYTNYVNWTDTLDLVTMATGYNIMILEVPAKYVDSSKVPDYENTKFRCASYHEIGQKKNGYDLTKPFLILIKKERTYELIISMKRVGKEDIVTKSFGYENDVIKFLYNYYLNTCIKESQYPQNYKFNELGLSTDIEDQLRGTEHEIKYEITNSYNKVIFVLTKRGVLIPVKQMGITGGAIKLGELIANQKLLSLDSLENRIVEVNNLLGKKYIELIAITNDNRAVLTNLGQLIPIKSKKIEDQTENEMLYKKYERLNYPYYNDIDEYLVGEKEFIDKAKRYIDNTKAMKQKIYGVKLVLGKVLSKKEELSNYIQQINRGSVDRMRKINLIVKIFDEIYNKIKDRVNIFQTLEKDELGFVFRLIANEMIDDNQDNLLLNNLVVSDVFDPMEIVKRENETILLNIDDIQKWSGKRDE